MAASALLTAAATGLFAQHAAPAGGEVTKAVAVLHPTKDSKVEGVVTFLKQGSAIRVEGRVTGLTPGKHGFHVHEFGDVSSEDGMATGAHFDIAKHMHGGPDDKDRHSGDLGNIEADASGKATIKMTDKGIALHGANSILGRALIVHAMPDDLKSQPSGNAGARIAQGVVGVAK